MSEKMMCPQCGGLVYATVGGVGERLCTCTERSNSVSGAKLCTNCGKDVTHDRRMKDKDGKYWCLSCGIEDKKKKQIHSQVCPDCNQKYPQEQMEVFEGVFVCKGCAILRRKTKKSLKKRMGISDLKHQDKSHKKGMEIALGIVLLLVVAVMVYMMMDH